MNKKKVCIIFIIAILLLVTLSLFFYQTPQYPGELVYFFYIGLILQLFIYNPVVPYFELLFLKSYNNNILISSKNYFLLLFSKFIATVIIFVFVYIAIFELQDLNFENYLILFFGIYYTKIAPLIINWFLISLLIFIFSIFIELPFVYYIINNSIMRAFIINLKIQLISFILLLSYYLVFRIIILL